MKYLITYDLLRPGQDYSDLYDAIQSLGIAKHGMQNVWFVKSNLSAAEIRDELKIHVDQNDKIFICEVVGWASRNLSEISDWLNGV